MSPFATHEVSLEVHQHDVEEVYHDRARIPEAFRGGIKEGRICKLSTGSRSVLLEMRGLQHETKQVVRLDERTRLELNVDLCKSYSFQLRPVWWWGQFRWAWNASDSAARIAARLGLLGLILGLFGIIAGLFPLFSHC